MNTHALTLITDVGPDVTIDEGQAACLASTNVYCGKTHKQVGSVALYAAGTNLTLYLKDKRRPVGKNRIALFFHHREQPSVILAAAVEQGFDAAGVKQALRLARMTDPDIAVNIAAVAITS